MFLRFVMLASLPCAVAAGLHAGHNPIEPGHGYGLAVGLLVTAWLVRLCDQRGELTPGVPHPKREPVAALAFGFARALEVIIVLWLPPVVLYHAPRLDDGAFIWAAKAAAYSSLCFWGARLSREQGNTTRASA